MNNYILTCCSTVDLTLEHLNSRNIKYVSFHFSIDDKEYVDDLGKSLPYEDFYNMMSNGAITKTSQVNVDQFINFFKEYLEQGLDILHISTSYGISGAYNSAMIARGILLEEYPERKINVINSISGCSGYGLLMDKTADMKDAGLDIDDLTIWVEENKANVHHWFYSSDLTHFVRGGRISKASGIIGGVLNINPILELNLEGKLVPRGKVIGKKRSQKRLLDIMINNATNQLGYADKCYIAHSNCLDDAKDMAAMIESKFIHLEGNVLINNIGTTVGSHAGPGTVAIFFWGNKRNV